MRARQSESERARARERERARGGRAEEGGREVGSRWLPLAAVVRVHFGCLNKIDAPCESNYCSYHMIMRSQVEPNSADHFSYLLRCMRLFIE